MSHRRTSLRIRTDDVITRPPSRASYYSHEDEECTSPEDECRILRATDFSFYDGSSSGDEDNNSLPRYATQTDPLNIPTRKRLASGPSSTGFDVKHVRSSFSCTNQGSPSILHCGRSSSGPVYSYSGESSDESDSNDKLDRGILLNSSLNSSYDGISFPSASLRLSCSSTPTGSPTTSSDQDLSPSATEQKHPLSPKLRLRLSDKTNLSPKKHDSGDEEDKSPTLSEIMGSIFKDKDLKTLLELNLESSDVFEDLEWDSSGDGNRDKRLLRAESLEHIPLSSASSSPPLTSDLTPPTSGLAIPAVAPALPAAPPTQSLTISDISLCIQFDGSGGRHMEIWDISEVDFCEKASIIIPLSLILSPSQSLSLTLDPRIPVSYPDLSKFGTMISFFALGNPCSRPTRGRRPLHKTRKNAALVRSEEYEIVTAMKPFVEMNQGRGPSKFILLWNGERVAAAQEKLSTNVLPFPGSEYSTSFSQSKEKGNGGKGSMRIGKSAGETQQSTQSMLPNLDPKKGIQISSGWAWLPPPHLSSPSFLSSTLSGSPSREQSVSPLLPTSSPREMELKIYIPVPVALFEHGRQVHEFGARVEMHSDGVTGMDSGVGMVVVQERMSISHLKRGVDMW